MATEAPKRSPVAGVLAVSLSEDEWIYRYRIASTDVVNH
jgi:hypothetical protein